MATTQALRQQDVIGFLDELYQGDLHAKRVLSLANASLGVIKSASLAIHAIGQGLAHVQGTLPKHGIKQVDRLVSNTGVDVWEFFSYWVPHVVGTRQAVVVALDWTNFAADRHDTIVLSMLTRHGRATPLLWMTVPSDTLKGAQTHYEDRLLQRLREVMPDGVEVTVVADRGFADCKLFCYLAQQLKFHYVIRLRGQYYVTDARGTRRKAADWVGRNGRARSLHDATVTDSQQYQAATVVCVQDPDMKQPWCLVSSHAQVPTRTLIDYYGKRWGIETSFRDIKDLRFGMGLSSLRVSQPQRRDRLLLLSALAIALLSMLGAAGESLGYDRTLKANTAKTRTHSLFRQGLMLYAALPAMPEARLLPLLERFRELLTAHRIFTATFAHI